MSETNHQTIMLADDNWKSYISHCPIYHGFGVFICSGKVTTIRAIFDKVKQNSNIKTVIICLSSNNYDVPSAVNLSTNINSALKNKFKNTNIFITLAGICKSLNEKQIEALESINHVFRNKVSCTIINAPDSFSTTNGHAFTDMTRHNFYKCVTSFFILKVETLKRLQNMRPFILTSEYTPSDSDIAILSKGPSFCYPFYPPKFVYLKYIYDFIRRIQWSITLKKHYFKSNNRFGKINSNKWISVDRITNATKKLSSIILNSSHNILNCYEPKSSAPKIFKYFC